MSRRTYYTERGRTPRNCWTCDGVHACKCDKVTLRAAKRSARQAWALRAVDEVAELIDEWSQDSEMWEVQYLCGDCLDEGTDCPRCSGRGGEYAAVMRNVGALPVDHG